MLSVPTPHHRQEQDGAEMGNGERGKEIALGTAARLGGESGSDGAGMPGGRQLLQLCLWSHGDVCDITISWADAVREAGGQGKAEAFLHPC